MSNPVCISPLKFYDSPAKQNHRKSYAYNHISPLITKINWIPPFQFIIPTSLYNAGGSLVTACLYDAKSNNLVFDNIISTLIYTGFSIDTIDGYKVLNYKSLKKLLPDTVVPEWEAGEINADTGLPVSALLTTRQRTVSYIPAIYADKIIDTSSSFGYYVYQYDINYNYLGRTTSTRIYKYQYNVKNALNADCVYIKIASKVEDSEIPTITLKNNNLLKEGLYYLKLSSANDTWAYYSEVFCFTEVTQDSIEIEYWNETGNFAVKNGVIAFPSDFHFKLLLKGEIGKPEYNFEEESTKRLGYVYVESQVSKKTYKFNTIVPEYICDALRLVRLCDNKIIRCKDDEYEAITFEMEADWQTQGDLASVTCEFETDNVIANIGGFVPDKLGGDYNSDYNEDFDKE